jgi:hypothetical protein
MLWSEWQGFYLTHEKLAKPFKSFDAPVDHYGFHFEACTHARGIEADNTGP